MRLASPLLYLGAHSHLSRAIDADGLLLSNTKDLRPGQEKYTREKEEVEEWEKGEKGYELLETIKRVKPTVLIGVSTEKEAFSEEVSFVSCRGKTAGELILS